MQAITALLQQQERQPSDLLQLLIPIQDQFGYIPEQAISELTAALETSRAQIRGVVEFYHFLSLEPMGDYRVLFSDNIIEQFQDNRALADELMQALGVQAGQLRGDGRVSVGFTACTGMSDQGPAALINGHSVTRLDSTRIQQMAKLIESATPLVDWPAEWFRVEDNIRHQDMLLQTTLTPGDAVRAVMTRGKAEIFTELEKSALRGRGGAGFPTASKWHFCHEAAITGQAMECQVNGGNGAGRVVVCNADEGEPGTFKDRVLLQSHADRVIEGMTLCAHMIGADTGFIYLRGEYRYLLDTLNAELARRREAGLLGKDILGESGFDFDIKIHLGAGAYICGEESALIESLEGKRGVPRIRPPFPVTHGYLSRPTVVNNVETFVAAAMIASQGADWFRSRGTETSTGTKLLSIAGDCERPGIYEVPFGITIEAVLDLCGANDAQAVQIAGAAGRMIPAAEFGRQISFNDVATGGSFMVFGPKRDMLAVAENFARFFVDESCGFCTPCRVGTSLLRNQLHKFTNGHATREDIEIMHKLGELMQRTSHCGLGQTAPNPVLDLMNKFPQSLELHLCHTRFEPGFSLDAALAEAREITGRDDPAAHLECSGV